MMPQHSPQAAQYRLARHYLEKLQRASDTLRRGQANRVYWLGRIDQDWGQISHWQKWSANGAAHDTDRAQICAKFPSVTADLLRLRQSSFEQRLWVEQALDAARTLGDQETERDLLYQVATLNLTLEAPDRAEQAAHQLAERARALGDTLHLGRATFVIGAVQFITGNYDRAEQTLAEAEPLLEACGALRDLGQVYVALGRVYNVRGDYATAHDYYRRYLEAAQSAGHTLAVLEAQISLAGIHIALDDPSAAEGHARKALEMARPFGVTRFLPPSLFSLAHAQAAQGDDEGAGRSYEEGISAARAILSAPSVIVNGLHGLGRVKARQGDAGAALRDFEEAMTLAREAGYLLRLCEVTCDAAILYASRGEAAHAEARVREALECAVKLDTSYFMAKALGAAVYWRQACGDNEQAAIWAGLLTTVQDQLYPSLFDAAIYDRLADALGRERYDAAIERGKTLSLRDTISGMAAG